MPNSDCIMPMAIPPASVHQNERKPPMSAAASTVTISVCPLLITTPIIKTSNTPANPASTPPSAQLTEPTVPMRQPNAASLHQFSDTAVIASPNVVREYTNAKTTNSTTAIA